MNHRNCSPNSPAEFELGDCVIAPDLLALLSSLGVSVNDLLARHAGLDHGDLLELDLENDRLKPEGIILSVYLVPSGLPPAGTEQHLVAVTTLEAQPVTFVRLPDKTLLDYLKALG